MKSKTLLILLVAAITRFNPLCSFAQSIRVPDDQRRQMHHEVPGDKYLRNAYDNKKTSPAMRTRSTGVFTAQVNVNASGQNILGDAANEPNIAVDPIHPNNIVIGWRQFDNVASNFRQAGWSYTSDAGQTWTFPGVIEPGIFRSDPVLDYDSAGNFYYNSLTSDATYHCKVFKSYDGGAIWDAGVEAKGGDKQWMTIDRTRGVGSGNIYACWNSSYSFCPPGFFTRSTDEGVSYEDCVVIDGYPYWGTMAVGNDGELYIGGTYNSNNGVVVSKSTNVETPGSAIAWDFPVEVDMDGFITGWTPMNPEGILGQVNIDVDRSNGPGRGNVYVLASVVRTSSSDPADVMFAKSTDGGLTWGFPIQVNDDASTSNYQWFGTMSVAPNGRIDVVWLDTRDAPAGSDQSALYYSYSTNRGESFSVNEKISDSFDPHIGYPQQYKMGDYFDMVSDNAGAHLAWANTLNGEEDVYYTHILPDVSGIDNRQVKNDYCSVSCYPNPFRDQTMIRYQVAGESVVKMSICNVYGQEITTLVNKKQSAGIYNFTFSANGLSAGYYLCKLTAGTNTVTTRMVVMK